MANPYDGYDAIDPWDDDPWDEDAWDEEMDEELPEDDPSPYAEAPYDLSSAIDEPGDAFPATMVRPNYAEVVREHVEEPVRPEPQGAGKQTYPRVLRRKEGHGRRVGDPRPESTAAYPVTQERVEPAGHVPQARPVEPVRPPARETHQYAEPDRPRRRRRRHHGCLVTLMLVVAALVGLYWVVAHPIDEHLAFDAQEAQTLRGNLSWSVPGMPYYVLALGSDAREGDISSRTDSMLLMRVDLVGAKLTLVSIPRDTKVEIEGVGAAKINAAYAYGDAGGAVRAVSKLTGVPIHHVAVIHFDELAGLIDYLGGVSVNVPEAVSDPYTGISLDAGMQTLDGTTAVLWARSRYGYAEGDFQRQQNQRILITALMNRMLSLSPREVPAAFAQMGDLVGTDMRCYNLVPLFVRFRLGSPQVYSCTLPTTSAYLDDQWYELADDAAVARVMDAVDAGEDPNGAL